MSVTVTGKRNPRRIFQTPTTEDPAESRPMFFQMPLSLKSAVAAAAERLGLSAAEFMRQAALEKLEREKLG